MALDYILYKLGTSLLRPSNYTVAISAPDLSNASRRPQLPFGNILTIHAEDVTFPGRQVITKQVTYFGTPREMPYDSAFAEDITITFNMTKNDGIREQLEIWMDAIVDPYLGIVNYYSQYTAGMRIALQNSEGNDSIVLVADEVYPKAIMPISLGAALSDEYVRYGVNFGFRRYQLVDLTAGIQQEDA